MKRNLFALFVLVAISTLFTACNRNPLSPSDNNPPPTGSYEPVPTERHYLLDANGDKTHMWARLLAEPSPPRGSTITLGYDGKNCAGCFKNLSLEYGLDQLPNPNTAAGFSIGFSQDGVNIWQNVSGGAIRGSGTAQTNPTIIMVFNDKPKYLVVQASFRGDSGGGGTYITFPGESGTANFLFDYK